MVESSFTVHDVRFEHFLPQNTLGVADTQPRLSWRISDVPSDFEQSSYEVEITEETPSGESKQLCSKTVNSSSSSLVPWPCEAPLTKQQKIQARVRCWGKSGAVSNWSEVASIETGL